MSKIAILVVIVLIVAVGIYTELQRGGNLSATARRLGLDFRSGLQPVPGPLAEARFDLLLQGKPEIGNRMGGRRKDRELMIFDYSYDATVAGEGFGAHPVADDQTNLERRNQTVILLQGERRFPDFDISPSASHQRQVAQRFGFTPLQVNDNPGFNRAFHLLGGNPERVSRLFSPAVQDFLMQHPGLVVEGRGDRLLLYRFQKRLKAKQIAPFLEEAEALLELLEGAMGSRGA
ncbi:MAG: hypothetical protein OQL28_11600 [Sedimenticola sp.]|nr:hypothetical protein [Sedimenticola sp.]